MRSANYVEETTTSIAGTVGDGAVTLTAITNVPRFSTVFGTQNTTVRYVIEDTVNKKFETGIGAVSSNVLTRTRPQITWDGTTYDDSAPAAIQFGATPTSGNVKIRIAATAEALAPTLPQIQTTVAGDTWRDYPLTASLASTNGNGSNHTVTAGREYYCAYKLDRAGFLAGVQYQVAAAVAATSIKVALYSCGYNGTPGAKIVDFATTATTTTGAKTDTATGSWTPATGTFLTPGWYYIGFIAEGAIALLAQNGNLVGPPTVLGRKDGYGYANTVYIAGNYTTGLPASPSISGGTLISNGVNGAFWIGLKVAA